jgi:hypothetical protein
MLYYLQSNGPHGLPAHRTPVYGVREAVAENYSPMVHHMLPQMIRHGLVQVKIMFLGQYPMWINVYWTQIVKEE